MSNQAVPPEGTRVEVGRDNLGIIVVGNNNTISQGEKPFNLVRLPPRPGLPVGAGPASLLTAHYEMAPFVDSPERQTLEAWLGESHPLAALLLSAPGGYGKTRLGIEVCRQAAADGWDVVLAISSSDFSLFGSGETAPDPGTDPQGTLVFVDYADRWSQTDIQKLFLEMAQRPGPVRLLMAARSESFWTMTTHPLRSLGFRLDRLQVHNIGGHTHRARELYASARSAFGTALGCSPVAPASHRFGDEADVRSTLEIHVCALLDALRVLETGDNSEAVPARTAWAELSRELIERELNHWGRMATAMVPMRTSLDNIFRCTVLSTLMRGLSFPLARQLLADLAFIDPEQAIADHARLYPSAKPETVMWPLLPDRIGEDLIATALSTAPDGSRLIGWSGPSNDRLVAELLAHETEHVLDDGSIVRYSNFRLRPAIVVLAEAAQRWPHLQDILLEAFRLRPHLAIIAGGRALALVAEALPTDVLHDVYDQLGGLTSNGANLDLHEGIIRILERLHSDPSFDSLSVEARIAMCDSFGNHLYGGGQRNEAESVQRQAVDLILAHQVIVDEDEVTVLPGAEPREVGATLAHYANTLSACGRSTESLTFSMLAMEIFRQWLEAGGDDRDSGYLAAASAYATALAETGHLEESLQLHLHLLRMMGGSVDSLTEAQKADATVVMNNLGIRLFEAGHAEDGLTMLRQATAIRASLAEWLPPLYLTAFAESLHNLAWAEQEAGHLDTATDLAREAVKIRCTIADNVPGTAQGPALRSLDLLVRLEVKNGELDQAVATAAEHVRRCWKASDEPRKKRVETFQRALERRLQLLQDAGRASETNAYLASILAATSGKASDVLAELTAWVAMRACLQSVQDGNVDGAAHMVERYWPALEACDAQYLDAQSTFLVALELTRAQQPFETCAPVVRAMLRSAGRSTSQETLDASQPLPRETLEVVLHVAQIWAQTADSPEQNFRCAQIVLEALPLLEQAMSWSPAAKNRAAQLCNNAAAIFQSFGSHGGGTDEQDTGTVTRLARLAVRAYTELDELGSADDDDVLTALNTLALALTFGPSPESADLDEALQASAKSVRLAEKRARELRSLPAVADLAMCLETYAQTCAATGKADEAMSAINFAVSLLSDAARLAGQRLLPALLHGCQIFESVVTRIGRETETAAMWSALEQSLPPELCAAFVELRDSPVQGRGYSV